MSLDSDAKKVLKEMFDICDGVDVDQIKADGITIRSGTRLIKLEVVRQEPITVEDEIREEYRAKIHEKMQEIKSRLNTRLMETVEQTKRIKAEAERKESQYKRKLRELKPMPEILYSHASRGLSVVKGDRSGELKWLLRGVYWPKTYDNKPIEASYSKRLMSEVVFVVTTSGERITKVTTHRPIGLDYFDHYHQQGNGDCWGNWTSWKSKKWNSPDDIIKIGREAEAVLENINPHSIAKDNPSGLPRKSSLVRHIKKKGDKLPRAREDAKMRRMGISNDMSENDDAGADDIWTS